MSSKEKDAQYCMYDDGQVKPDCPVQNTHDYFIGYRLDCWKCAVYKKWRVDHEEELEAITRGFNV